jgi:hypothetical protein
MPDIPQSLINPSIHFPIGNTLGSLSDLVAARQVLLIGTNPIFADRGILQDARRQDSQPFVIAQTPAD